MGWERGKEVDKTDKASNERSRHPAPFLPVELDSFVESIEQYFSGEILLFKVQLWMPSS